MFDEQQEPRAGDHGAVEESINMPSRSDERADTEPVPRTEGSDVGKRESSDSGAKDAI